MFANLRLVIFGLLAFLALSLRPTLGQFDLSEADVNKPFKVKFDIPRNSWLNEPRTVEVSDVRITEPSFDLSKGEWSGAVSGTIGEVDFTYTSDVVPNLGGKSYLIMYPIGWHVSTRPGKLNGKFAGTSSGVFGDVTVELDGTVEIAAPTEFLRKETFDKTVKKGKPKSLLSILRIGTSGSAYVDEASGRHELFGEIPVPKGDNDPDDGSLGWEYKTWDKPLEGVRQPRRDDTKGCPEFIRGHGGPLNFYLYLRTKSHKFKASATFAVASGKVTPSSLKFQLVDSNGNPKTFVACPKDFKKARKEGFDWDYAIDASGPLAEIIQDEIVKHLDINNQVNAFVGKPYEIDFSH